MDCKIDFKAMMNEKFNNMLLHLDCGDKAANEITSRLIEFANKYHIYGIDAMCFISELMELITDLKKINQKGENNEN